MEGAVLGGGGDEAHKIPVVYPRGVVIISSIGSFSSVGSSSKPSFTYLPLYLGARHIKDYFKKKKGRKRKFIKPQL